MTWFRKEAGVEWFPGFGTDPLVQKQAGDLVASEPVFARKEESNIILDAGR